jgi:hypothetical protein
MDKVCTVAEFLPWMRAYAKRNKWKFRALAMDQEDVIQEGMECFAWCRQQYLDPDYQSTHPQARVDRIRNVTDKPHFIYLCQRNVKSHLTRLANKDTRNKHVELPADKTAEELDTRSVMNQGELLIRIKEMTVNEWYAYCDLAGVAPLAFLRMLRQWPKPQGQFKKVR